MANQAGIAATVELAKLGLSADKIDEYKAAFNVFAGNSDRITIGRLREMLNNEFGQKYEEEDLRYMLSQFGDSAVGVDFLSFAKAMHEKMSDSRYNEAFGDAFDLFDSLGKNELDETSLRDGMRKLGEELTDSEVKELLKIAKKKDDFVRTMTASLSSAPVGAGSAAAAPAAASAAPAAAPAAAGSAPRPGPAAAGGGAPRPGGGPAGPGGPGPSGGPPRPGGAPAAPGPTPGGPPRPGGGPAGPGGPPRPGGAPAAPGVPGGPPRPPRP